MHWEFLFDPTPVPLVKDAGPIHLDLSITLPLFQGASGFTSVTKLLHLLPEFAMRR